MKDECNLSIKKATFWPEARRSKDKTLQDHLVWAAEWSQTDNVFDRGCIFIDESDFNININRVEHGQLKEKQQLSEHYQ
jgi:hypothetical protein